MKGTCELCKMEGDLRPYGPNGEWICITCGKKDPKTTEKMMGRCMNIPLPDPAVKNLIDHEIKQKNILN